MTSTLVTSCLLWAARSAGGLMPHAYLPASVARFDTRQRLADRMRGAGLAEVRWVDLTFGLVCVHVGVKPLDGNQ